MGNPIFDIILFDLGGVFVKLTGVTRMVEWTQGVVPVDELWNRWMTSPGVRDFETGKTSPEEFSVAMINEFGLIVEPKQFLTEFIGWSNSLYPGTNRLLNTLSHSYTIASLSNTNSLHWDYFCDGLDFLDYFDYNFPSHETGFAKPDEEAFLNVLEKLDCPPEKVLFFDDTSLNIEGAKSVGIRAFQTQGVGQVASKLNELGVLEDRDFASIFSVKTSGSH